MECIVICTCKFKLDPFMRNRAFLSNVLSSVDIDFYST